MPQMSTGLIYTFQFSDLGQLGTTRTIHFMRNTDRVKLNEVR